MANKKTVTPDTKTAAKTKKATASTKKKMFEAEAEAKVVTANIPDTEEEVLLNAVTNTEDVYKDINLDQLIPVYNGFHGVLVYASKKTGEIYQWDNFGDYQDIELKELKVAKSSSKDFFINNWFMFDDEHQWVIDYLGLQQFYKNSISLEGFEDILTLTPAKIKSTIAGMSKGQKDSLMYMVKNMVANNEIDSLKTLSALEEGLGITLIEKN